MIMGEVTMGKVNGKLEIHQCVMIMLIKLFKRIKMQKID